MYYHNGYLGSANYLTDERGNIRAVTTSDEWGNVREGSNNDINIAGLDRTFGYTSYTYDKVLDLSFAQRRFYDGSDRRFISQDPVKDGVNWYRYCEGNPVRFVDPWGENALPVSPQYVGKSINFSNISFMANTNGKFKISGDTIAQYDSAGKKIVTFWKKVAEVTSEVILKGKGDKIFVKLAYRTTVEQSDMSYSEYVKKFGNNYEREEGILYTSGHRVPMVETGTEEYINWNRNIDDYMYFRNGEGIISKLKWETVIHHTQRNAANSDGTLPSSPKGAREEKFEQLLKIAAKYHGGDKGNLKYIHQNGREAIYKDKTGMHTSTGLDMGKQITENNNKPTPIYSSKPVTPSTEIKQGLYGLGPNDAYELVPLAGNADIGPTFNYVYCKLGAGGTTGDFNGHYFFDMLPYYNWGTKE